MVRSSVIAATKLAVPRPLQTRVARPDLMERLGQPTYQVAVVSAPAGYGKTAMLAEWASSRPGPVAWVSCDEADEEPRRFWRGLLAAVASVTPGLGDDALVLLQREGAESQGFVTSLANDLGEVRQPFALIVDDLHLAKPAPDVLAGLISALPSNVKLLLGSRSDPPFSLARLRVGGYLLEMHSKDLRFSEAETALVLDLGHIAVTPEEMRLIHDLTEGWPAGVQLAALSLQRGTDVSEFLAGFAATDRAVADFLVNEVLDRQPPELVEFLSVTSVLDEFDAPLCAEVSGRDDAASLLDRVIGADLFVVPLDDSGTRFRYHHLIGAFLRARLKSQGRDRQRMVHVLAGQALEMRGDVVGALRHAMASEDVRAAAAVITRSVERSMSAVDSEMTAMAIRAWLHEHGEDLMATDPVRLFDFLAPLVVTEGTDEVVWWLNRIEEVHDIAASSELTALVHGVRSEYHIHRGGSDDGLRNIHRAMEAVDWDPPREGLFPLLHTVLVRAHLLAGDIEGAERSIDAATARATGHRVLDDVRLPGLRSWVMFLRGDLNQAEVIAESAVRWADRLELPEQEVGRIFAGLTTSCSVAERNDLSGAEKMLERMATAADMGRRPPLQSLVALQQARLASARMDEVSAAGHLKRAQLLLVSASATVQARFALEEAHHAILFDPPKAHVLLDAMDDRPEVVLLRAKLALADEDPKLAGSLLDVVAPASSLAERVERLVLVALTLVDRDVDHANKHLGEALRLAEPQGFVRTIVAQGSAVPRLLASFPADEALEPFVRTLTEASNSQLAPLRRPVDTTLVEPLSERETTVLRYLASRLTNQEIAAALYVSLNTMKSHLRNVYRKLGVTSRAEAVEAGRRLRII